ncbi:hypothetical protein N617_gp10 [Stygiolobus rod-shaped virus]|uniref:Uncharacterized protein n=1 Tax=Stygiolobus rod-shaped virus TaxID=537009 RepID=B6EFB6_9VIRU|nr:hypothetical protein N617_gp10 [Stygiolobus rod-shaped virus]CAQ58451.1 hypothetical protein [Stygiolobus rod-shaped virus]
MSQIDNLNIIRCKTFLLQLKNWVEKRYITNDINIYIDDFETYSMIQIQFFSREATMEKYADQIYRYILKTFYDPKKIHIRYVISRNKIKIIAECSYQ